jgi:hypothetical protein
MVRLLPHPLRLLLLPALLGLLPFAAWAAEIYRWTDADGSVVFSDKPAPGAERIEVGEPTIVPAEPLPPAAEETGQIALEEVPYDEVVIASPPHDATLRDQQEIAVSVASSPPLQSQFGHRVQLFFDGAPYGEPVDTTEFLLQNVDRGSHELAAVIVDGAGRELARSGTSVFHLHKTSIQHPNYPNRPKKPTPAR